MHRIWNSDDLATGYDIPLFCNILLSMASFLWFKLFLSVVLAGCTLCI